MKALLLAVWALLCCSSPKLQAADPWKEQPMLSAITHSAFTAISEYEIWAGEWKIGKRKPEGSDYTLNLLTETALIALQYALEEHPNQVLLEKCLIFLGTQVQPEFDHIWKARILEMA